MITYGDTSTQCDIIRIPQHLFCMNTLAGSSSIWDPASIHVKVSWLVHTSSLADWWHDQLQEHATCHHTASRPAVMIQHYVSRCFQSIQQVKEFCSCCCSPIKPFLVPKEPEPASVVFKRSTYTSIRLSFAAALCCCGALLNASDEHNRVWLPV